MNKLEKEQWFIERKKEMKEIKQLLNSGCQVHYHNNWIEINGKHYNGYDRAIIQAL